MTRGKCVDCNQHKAEIYRLSVDNIELGRYCVDCGKEKISQVKARFGWVPEVRQGFHPSMLLGYKKIKEIFC